MKGGRERRENRRLRVKGMIPINGGRPFDGGHLFDLSATGLAVTYPTDCPPWGDPLKPGQEVVVKLGGISQSAVEVVRVERVGFAGRFV